MNIRFEVENDASSRLRSLAGNELPEARRRMVRESLVETLSGVIKRQPVETGRARAAWDAALEQLGGASSGGPGDSPAIAEGRRAGRSTLSDSTDSSQASAANSVSYITYLEYGTSKMAPFAMIRRSLASVARRVGEFFQLVDVADGHQER